MKKELEWLKSLKLRSDISLGEDGYKYLDNVISTCQLLCDVSDKMEPKKEVSFKNDFENYLMDIHGTGYIGTDDNMPDAFEDWLQNLDIDTLIEYGNGYGRKEQLSARSEDILWATKKMMGITPEKLHKWYLEATDKLDPASFNREAQKPYKKLTEEQKFIDKYIADAIRQEILGGGK